jgi:serine/threonine-protein kinase RsbW
LGYYTPDRGIRQADDQTHNHRFARFVRRSSVRLVSSVTKPLSLSVEADAKALGAMRRTLSAWLEEIEAARISDVVLAVDEAVANAIEHAGLRDSAVITVTASVSGPTLHIEICDHGVWKDPTPNESRGRGLLIMNAVMDGVAIEHRDDDTRIVMSRHLR